MNNPPNVEEIVNGWSKKYSAIVVTKTMDEDGILQETRKEVSFYGMLQPLNGYQLSLKPEGERDWGWYKLYTTYHFKNSDYLLIEDKKYKIMTVKPYKDFTMNYGYFRYELVENYIDN